MKEGGVSYWEYIVGERGLTAIPLCKERRHFCYMEYIVGEGRLAILPL